MEAALIAEFRKFLEHHAGPDLSRLEKQQLLDFKVEFDLETGRPSLVSMQAVWDSLSAKYDSIPSLDQRVKVFEKLYLTLAFHGDEDILSLGCGSGLYEIFLAKHLNPKGKTHGLDFSRPFLEAALRLAQKEDLAHKLSFLESPGSQIPLPDQSIDKVLCLHSLEYMPDWEGVLLEVRRVLKQEDSARFVVFCNEFPPASFSFKAFLGETRRLGFKPLESSVIKVKNFLGGEGEIAFFLFQPAG